MAERNPLLCRNGARLVPAYSTQLAAGVDSRLEVVPDQGHMVTFIHPTTSTTMLKFFREVLAEKQAE